MKVTHPSMSSFAAADGQTQQSPPPVYTVAPPDENALFEQQMAAVEQTAVPNASIGAPTQTTSIDDPIIKKEVDRKLAFEKLMFLSQDRSKDVEYGGLTFKFKVLKSNDNARILELLQESSLTEAYQASVMGLAASLVSVNGVAFEDFYTGTEPLKDALLRKYSELLRWPAFMVTTLMNLSSTVQREVEVEFDRGFLSS